MVSEQPLRTQASKGGRSLDSFVNDKQDNYEEEEEDIYEMYQRKINERPSSAPEQRTAGEVEYKLDQKLLDPDMPRFEQYFNQQ